MDLRLTDMVMDMVDNTVTRGNASLLILGAVGGFIAYRLGKRTGNWIYDRHIHHRRKHWLQ